VTCPARSPSGLACRATRPHHVHVATDGTLWTGDAREADAACEGEEPRYRGLALVREHRFYERSRQAREWAEARRAP